MQLELASGHLTGIEHVTKSRHRIVDADHLARRTLRSVWKRRQRYLPLRPAVVVPRNRFRDGVVDRSAVKDRLQLFVTLCAGIALSGYNFAAVKAAGHAKSVVRPAPSPEAWATETWPAWPKAALCV